MLSLKQEIRLANQDSLQKGEEMFTIFQKFMINTQARTNQEEIPISTLAQVSQMSLEAASLPPQSHNPTQPHYTPHYTNLSTIYCQIAIDQMNCPWRGEYLSQQQQS